MEGKGFDWLSRKKNERSPLRPKSRNELEQAKIEGLPKAGNKRDSKGSSKLVNTNEGLSGGAMDSKRLVPDQEEEELKKIEIELLQNSDAKENSDEGYDVVDDLLNEDENLEKPSSPVYPLPEGVVKNLAEHEDFRDEPSEHSQSSQMSYDGGASKDEIQPEVKTEMKEENDFDAIDLGLDESSNQSWGTMGTNYEDRMVERTKRELSVSPVPPSSSNTSGRTTPDHDAPPIKRGKRSSTDSKGYRSKFRGRPESRMVEKEADPHTIARREKQIEYGKVSVDYQEFQEEVPPRQRTKDHPRTPEKYQKTSRRSFDQQIKIWKRNIHHWRNPEPSQSQSKKGSPKKMEPLAEE